MTAYVCSQTGNWSSAATWGGVGVPTTGDTCTIGAFTVTVDVNTSVGTSPNDVITKVVDQTSAIGSLIVASGVTFTVKGNFGGVNASVFTMSAGSTLTFDASASAGSPVYTWVNTGFQKYNFNGSSISRCIVQAIAGKTFSMNPSWASFVASYTDFVRCSSIVTTSTATAGPSITSCTFDNCNSVNITQASGTFDFIFNDNRITNSTHVDESLRVTLSGAHVSGTRSVSRNSADKQFTNIAKSLIFDDNYFGGISCGAAGASTFARTPRNNFFDNTQNLNGGNGMLLYGTWDGVYVVSSNSSGNPHFVSPNCTNSADESYQRFIFESQSPDLVDTGDCFLANGAFCTDTFKAVMKNCIVLRSPLTGVTSGQLLTSISAPATNSTHQSQFFRCTANQNKSAVGGVGIRGTVAFAEGGTGGPDQISALKSNLAWATATANGYFGERVTGNVKDIITAAQTNYNWLFNIDAGDNLRGYEDKALTNTLWTAGNASAASVDVNQGSGNPVFKDNTRCVATWCLARGYGASTYAAGLAALKANPTRIADLINYIFEGFKLQNAACRTAAHDGGCVGAANWDKQRALTKVSSFRSYANAKYAVSA